MTQSFCGPLEPKVILRAIFWDGSGGGPDASTGRVESIYSPKRGPIWTIHGYNRTSGKG